MRGVAALAILTCLVLFAGFLYLADRVGTPPAGPAAAFLPDDGQTWFDLETVNDGSQEWSRLLSVENARLSGPAALQSLDGALADAVVQNLGVEQVLGDHFWRNTSTLIDAEFSEQQTLRLYRAAPDVSLVAESEASLALLYNPPLVLLPQNPQPGATWTGSGSTSLGLSYEADFTLTAAAPDCVISAGTIEYGIGGLDAALVREVSYTWCPGTGIVHTTEVADGSDVVLARTDHEHSGSAPSAHSVHTWEDPDSWQEHRSTARSVHGSLGESPILSVPGSAPAALTESGLLVRASMSQDVLALSPDGADHLTLAWSAHPGGQILSVTTFGDLIVVTTSQRQIVAYSAAGVRLWSQQAGDLVMARPVALDEAALLAVTVSGEVLAVDLGTGDLRWQAHAGSDVGADPVVAGGAGLIATRTGAVMALDGQDGAEQWRTEIPSGLVLAATQDVVVAAGYTSLTGLDLSDGTALWTSSLPGTARSMVGTADTIVVATDERTYALTADGTEQWRHGGAAQVLTDGAYLALLTADGISVLSADGQHVGEHRAAMLPPGHLLSTPAGVGLIDGTWDVRMWHP